MFKFAHRLRSTGLGYWAFQAVIMASSLLLNNAGLAQAGDETEAKKEEPELVLSAEEQGILNLTNKERLRQRLPELRPNAKLFKAAREHSDNMAKRNALEHTLGGRSPFDRMKEAGYSFGSAGENIAFGASTPTDAVQMWMQSPGHRTNILGRNYVEIGIGIATNASGRKYFTQVFAAPGCNTGR